MAPKDASKESARLWVEKYRPRAVSDVAHQTQVVSTLQKAVTEGAGRGDLPHLLFYGPPGTGKTSTALALCRDLFGPQNLRSRLLELNASDERGIHIVRDKIKNFAQTTVSHAKPSSNDSGKSYPCPPFKVVVLDEADAITTDAQTALRRTMEAHANVTRFILICNYISRIIEPLTSRCAKFRFNPLPLDAMTSHLRTIANAEQVDVTDDTLGSLISASHGDLRMAVNVLQSAYRMVPRSQPLTIDDITVAACLVPFSVVENFDKAVAKPNASNAAARAAVDHIIAEGYSALQLLKQYADFLNSSSHANHSDSIARLTDIQKAAVAIAIAQAEKNLIDGCDEQIQLYNVASRIATIVSIDNDVDALRVA